MPLSGDIWKNGLKVKLPKKNIPTTITLYKPPVIPPVLTLINDYESKVQAVGNLAKEALQTRLHYVLYFLDELPENIQGLKRPNYIFQHAADIASCLTTLLQQTKASSDSLTSQPYSMQIIKQIHQLSYDFDCMMLQYRDGKSKKGKEIVLTKEQFVDPKLILKEHITAAQIDLATLQNQLSEKIQRQQLQRRPTLYKFPKRTSSQFSLQHHTTTTPTAPVKILLKDTVNAICLIATQNIPFGMEYMFINCIAYALQDGDISSQMLKFLAGMPLGIYNTFVKLFQLAEQNLSKAQSTAITLEQQIEIKFARKIIDAKNQIELSIPFNEENEKAFAQAFLQHLSCNQYLPKSYKVVDIMSGEEGLNSTVDILKFYSSNEYRSGLWCAHKDGNVIASSGPSTDASDQ